MFIFTRNKELTNFRQMPCRQQIGFSTRLAWSKHSGTNPGVQTRSSQEARCSIGNSPSPRGSPLESSTTWSSIQVRRMWSPALSYDGPSPQQPRLEVGRDNFGQIRARPISICLWPSAVPKRRRGVSPPSASQGAWIHRQASAWSGNAASIREMIGVRSSKHPKSESSTRPPLRPCSGRYTARGSGPHQN